MCKIVCAHKDEKVVDPALVEFTWERGAHLRCAGEWGSPTGEAEEKGAGERGGKRTITDSLRESQEPRLPTVSLTIALLEALHFSKWLVAYRFLPYNFS